MAEIIYGSIIASEIRRDIKNEILELKQQNKRLPHLVVVLLGDNISSLSYVKGKEKACIEIGMENTLIQLDENISEEALLKVIKNLNDDINVDGILVQLPLPKQIDENRVLFTIDPQKDVDGFHPYNIGKMMMQVNTFLPCTPKGIITLLEHIGFDDLSGKKAVIIGRSNIVGKPVAQLLLNKHATVTICHSRTKDIEHVASQGDILIAAVGQAKLINRNWIKPGAIVIDVGVNRDEYGKLCGDVDFEDVKEVASYITPVPKGVGPMTIAMLLENTLEAYHKHEEERSSL